MTNIKWMLLNYSQNYSYILDTRTAIHYSLVEWQTCMNITFSETTNIKEADIKVEFLSKENGGSFPFDGPGNKLAHAFYPNSEFKGLIQLDSDENWYYNFLFHVILHEMGHVFGLGHSSDKESVMYPYFIDKTLKKLNQDDCNAVGSLYGLKSKWGPINDKDQKHINKRHWNESHTTRRTTQRNYNPKNDAKPSLMPTKKPLPQEGFQTNKINSTSRRNYKIYQDGNVINIYNSYVNIV